MTAKWDRLLPILRRGKWNFVHVIDAVIETTLSRSEKITLIAIASHVSDTHRRPSPGVRRLAGLTSQRVHTVMATVDALEKKGLIGIERRPKQAHVYDLSGTMRGLAAVVPIDTAPVSKEPTAPVVPIDTDDPPKADPSCCPDRHGAVVPFDQICVDPDNKRIQEGTNEGSRSGEPTPPPLVLASAAPKVAARRTKKPKPERSAEERKAFTAIRDTYFEAVEQKTGNKPRTFGKADGAAVYTLLEKCRGKSDLAVTYVRNAVLSDFGGTTSIRAIANDPLRFETMKTRDGLNGSRSPNRRREVQGGAADLARLNVRTGPSLE